MISTTHLHRIAPLVLAALLGSGAVMAQSGALTRVDKVLAAEATGSPARLQGVVVEVFYSKGFVLRDDTGLVLVRLEPKTMLKGTVERGDLVKLAGTTFAKDTLRTAVDASEVEVLSKAEGSVPSTRAASIKQIHEDRREGDVVCLAGKVIVENENTITIEDSTGTIDVKEGERFRNRVFEKGTQVVVVGQVRVGAERSKVLDLIGMDEVADVTGLEIPPEARGNVQTMSKALDGKKAGEEITTKGQVITYIGDKTVNAIYDGRNVLVIDPAPGGATMNIGEEVIVKGTLDFVEHKGKEVAVVRKAQVMKEMAAPK